MNLPKMLILNTLKCKLSNGGRESNILLSKAEYVLKSLCTRCTVMKLYTAISIYVVGSKPQAYNPESLKLILIYPYRLSVLSHTLEALIRQRKLK